MKTVEDPQIQAAGTHLDAPISREQFHAGMDLAVSVIRSADQYRTSAPRSGMEDECSCDSKYREGKQQVTILAAALARIHADPTLIPGFDAIMTDYMCCASLSAKSYAKFTPKKVLGVELKQAPRRLGDDAVPPSPCYDLSFTDFTRKPGLCNWTPAPDADRMTDDDTYPMGRNCMREIAKMAATSEFDAHVQITATFGDANFRPGYGKERGFISELAKYAIIGMRAVRAGVVNKGFDFEIYLDDGAIS